MGATQYYIGLRVLALVFVIAIAFDHCDARKSLRLSKETNHLKNVKLENYINMDATLMDSSNPQPSVSSPFTLPPYDSLSPENSPTFCTYPPQLGPPLSPPLGPMSSFPGPPQTITPSLPTVLPGPPNSVPSPLISGSSPPYFEPSPPGVLPSPTGISPSPPDFESSPPGLIPSPPSIPTSPPYSEPSPPNLVPGPTGTPTSPPYSGPSPPGLNPSPIGTYPSPPYSEPNPPSLVPSPTGISSRPPVFQPPVVYPPPVAPPLLPGIGGGGGGAQLWCVAKPTVPDPIIQEAMNYACGSGADCASIQPNGSCYEPNTVFAHASYAFNSYWQRTKVAGGTCEFGGTAMLVTVDPSSNECHFVLA